MYNDGELYTDCPVNLLLLQPADLIAPDCADIADQRALHIAQILKLGVGDQLRAGLQDGALGSATILAAESSRHQARYRLRLQLDQTPPAPLPLRLFLALPRPNMLGRLLRDVTSAGVKHIHLFHCAKVEKSYWQTPVLAEDSVARLLTEGLTQARDTATPTLYRHTSLEQALAAAALPQHRLLLADPFSAGHQLRHSAQPSCLFIGPEGGFTDSERQQILTAGAEPLWLGSRILRVEPAVMMAIGQLGAQLTLP